MTEKTARLLLGLGVPAVAALVGYGPYLAFWSDLPDPLASHFTSSGVPDGSMSPAAFMGVTSVLFGIGLLVCLTVAVYAKPISGVTGLGLASLGGFLSAFASGLLLETVLSQRGLASWTEASFSWTLTLGALALGLVAAAIAARLASHLPALIPQPAEGRQPVMDLAAGEQAVWSDTLRSSALTALGVAAILFAGFMALATSQWVSVAVVLVSAVAILMTASFKVRADRTGLRVNYGVLPWPRTHIAIDEIEQASVIDVRPKQWGGWGYRGSLTLMKQAAAVLRAGPGIRVDLRNGKVFVVTIDNPETGVALLNAEVERSRVGV